MSRWKLALVIIAVLLLAVLGWRLWQGGPASPGGAPGMRGGGPDAPIPVTVVMAESADVPVYLNALGTVQALNTVTVNAQVAGQLKAIHFEEGEEIKEGALIAEIDPRTFQATLDQAVAKQKQDQAQLSASRSTLQRYEELIKQHFVSAQDLENQRQAVRQQEAMVAADAAAVANARTQLGYTRITAPITGVAGIRQIDAGNLIAASGAGIVTLTQVHPINVIFTLPQQDLEAVRRAGGGELPVTALDRSDSHALAEGVLKVVDNSIDPQTGTFRLKAEFANEDTRLWPGQFVNIRLETRVVRGGLVIPVQAVQRGPDSTYVYKLAEDDTVAVQPIQTGEDADGGRVVVTEGLAAGDRIVTEGQFRLKPGAKVLALAPGESAPAPAADAANAQAPNGMRRR
ncbi:MAG: efflux RND transporter periplasmic adaptor subunit [Xanthomonadales bacterium]|nr:efflux RND transporter periplasmic adaptor subunit [Xanthomonadales bacterium]